MRLNRLLKRATITGTLTILLVYVIVRLFNPDIVILLPIAGLIGLGSSMLAHSLVS